MSENINKILTDPHSRSGPPLVAEWLRTCVSYHARCGNSSDAPLPKRLVDVGSTPGCQEIRLRETQDLSGRYITLSHCWGSALGYRPVRSVRENVEKMKESIPWNTLSKTFQDAIWLTQELGIRYIWIDSLCILQDDQQDWLQESSKMHQIYNNGYLNIAATRANSGLEGCFAGRPAATQIATGVYVREEVEHRYWSKLNLDERGDGFACPLLSRGWCFQERLLSPRVLHFGPDEFVWECNSTIRCECREQSASPYTLKTSFPSQRNPVSIWCEIVETFSGCDLTNELDVFPALAGVAARFSDLNQDLQGKYLAGLWEANLVQFLCWSIKRPDRARRRSIAAPSFSWASLIGPVFFWFRARTPAAHAVLADCSCDPDPIMRFVAASSCSVSILGCLFPTSVLHEQGRFAILPQVEKDQQYMVKVKDAVETWVSGESAQRRVYFFFADTIDEWTVSTDELVYCLPLLGDPNQIVVALVLRREESSPDTYSRVGLVRAWGTSWATCKPEERITIV